ncbi:alcohol dehydrogenase [Acetobacter fallax]|uniref:Alcohol dehydrogenase n=1 Tax=Acetobacter fallax TaxID=1737473 RepID=A0ABX0K4K2_9PROT|nr:alcohol dehydrogenase [Acetobacter fallax]NHO31299.1 alcohol dehydrogenase [Acetobacter fallax]NHO34856.1 alcohol dehydrogenase [Acetobacter fallax]
MIRFSPRALAAFAITAGITSASLPALAGDMLAQPTTTPEGRPSAAGILPATGAEVASVTPVNLAGLLNYCVETELVSHDDGDSVQTALNAKTNAVPSDQNGNMDYAVGSAGQMIVAGKVTTVTPLDTGAQGKICSAVLARSKSMI